MGTPADSLWHPCVLLLAAAVFAGCGNNPIAGLPTVSLERAPPPISGGTLQVLRDGRTAIASDPDREAIYIVDLVARTARTVPLEKGDEPGRITEDGRGRAHVILRGAAAVLTLAPHDLANPVLERRAVCSTPRGIDYDAARERLWIACARGELQNLPLEGIGDVRSVTLDGDLRDVVVDDHWVLVSRFRSAEILLVIADTMNGFTTRRPPGAGVYDWGSELHRYFAPSVAWRLRSSPRGPVMVHQRAFVGPEPVPPEGTTISGAYYARSSAPSRTAWQDPCENGVAHATVSLLHSDAWFARTQPVSLSRAVLPVDVAVSAQGTLAVALAGELGERRAHGGQVALTSYETMGARWPESQCAPESAQRFPGQVVAVDFAGEDLVVQTREPAALFVRGAEIALAGASRRDTGHDVFHADLGGGIACASCHPEGGDDGHVWHFRATGPRRTLGMTGGLRPEGPYHWQGNVPSLRALMNTTMAERMDGPTLDDAQLSASQRWMERIPRLATAIILDPARTEQVTRGREVFDRAGCAGCHAGLDGSDGQLHAMGESRWRTATLHGLGARGPYFHDGCATTLSQTLDGCGEASAHNQGAGLSAAHRADLIEYLRTL